MLRSLRPLAPPLDGPTASRTYGSDRGQVPKYLALGRYGPRAVCPGSNPLSPDAVGAPRPRSGPADVPAALLVTAREGDPAAFARFVEHWDPNLRLFVHHTMAGDGSTDRVLAASYVRAFRALPRYRASQPPGLWLHRIAYLSVVDELRRLTRDPMRRRSRAHPLPAAPATQTDTTEPEPVAAITSELRRLAPDQRALAVLIDLEGFAPDAVATAFDTAPLMVRNRVGSARQVLVRAAPGFTETAKLAEPAGESAPDPDRSEIVRVLLAAVEVPAAGAMFWPDLGRRLLAERERPAAPTPDPAARLARSHPADLGFVPSRGPLSASVSSLAIQASHRKPRRRWRKPIALIVAVLAVAGLIAGAVAIGTSNPTPNGSVTGAELAVSVAAAFEASPYLLVDVVVEEPGVGGKAATTPVHLIFGQDGSWVITRTDAIDRSTFDATAGEATRLTIVDGATGAAALSLAGEDRGLAAGPPDPAATRPAALVDLAAVGPLIRTEPERRAEATRVGGVATWTYDRTLTAGGERWAVSVRRSDGLPMRIERTLNGTLVRRIRFSSWAPASDVPAGQFTQLLPSGTQPAITEHGFRSADLDAVRLLGNGAAVTPAWLPEGFEFAGVALRTEAPAGASTTGGGSNPPDVGVASTSYQRGPERITISTRSTTAPDSDWTDPFAVAQGTPRRRTLGDGRFNQTPVRITTDAVGRAQLWGISDGTVFTVDGDITAAEVFRLAASLR